MEEAENPFAIGFNILTRNAQLFTLCCANKIARDVIHGNKLSRLFSTSINIVLSSMTKYSKTVSGVKVGAHTYSALKGSRAQVWHGTAYKTSGGLTKEQLHQNKLGRIVSKSKFRSATKENRLKKYGYTTQKGQFGAVFDGKSVRKRSPSTSKRMHTSKR